eukprot:scaffold1328_cov162-Amphora_coffeaeformis.AAC.16
MECLSDCEKCQKVACCSDEKEEQCLNLCETCEDILLCSECFKECEYCHEKRSCEDCLKETVPFGQMVCYAYFEYMKDIHF